METWCVAVEEGGGEVVCRRGGGRRGRADATRAAAPLAPPVAATAGEEAIGGVGNGLGFPTPRRRCFYIMRPSCEQSDRPFRDFCRKSPFVSVN